MLAIFCESFKNFSSRYLGCLQFKNSEKNKYAKLWAVAVWKEVEIFVYHRKVNSLG